MHQLLGQGERFTTAPQGLIRIAQTPQGQGRPRSTNHALILSIERGRGVMLLKIIEGHASLQMHVGRGELSQEGRSAQHPVGQQEAPGLARAGPNGGAARPTRARSETPPVLNKNTIAPTTPGKAVGFPHLLAQLACPSRRIPLPGPHSPWWPSTPGPEWSARPAPAGRALGSRAAL